MRVFALIILVVMPPLAGRQTSAQTVHDERAEQECYEIMDTEAQRTGLDEMKAGASGRE